MELDGPDVLLGIGDARDGVRGFGGEMEAGGKFLGFIAVGHPGGHGGGEFGKEGIGVDEVDFGVAVFALAGGADAASEVMDDVLESITNSQDGKAEGQDCGIGWRRIGVVDGAGASGEDEADGAVGEDFVDGGGARKHHREDVLFTDAAGDELGVLRAEVEDDNCVLDLRLNGRSFHPSVWQGVGAGASGLE